MTSTPSRVAILYELYRLFFHLIHICKNIKRSLFTNRSVWLFDDKLICNDVLYTSGILVSYNGIRHPMARFCLISNTTYSVSMPTSSFRSVEQTRPQFSTFLPLSRLTIGRFMWHWKSISTDPCIMNDISARLISPDWQKVIANRLIKA